MTMNLGKLVKSRALRHSGERQNPEPTDITGSRIKACPGKDPGAEVTANAGLPFCRRGK
jgi:hypothetical protein